MDTKENLLTVCSVSLLDHRVQKLITKLDQYQASLYGAEHCNLDSIEVLQRSQAFMLGGFSGDEMVGIGAVKLFTDYGEIKRVFVEEKFRGSGVAAAILSGLELHTKQQELKQINLETGNLQHAAIRFYKKHGYTKIEKFGCHEPNPVSIYLSKNLSGDF